MVRMLHWLAMFGYLAGACAMFAWGFGIPAHEVASWVSIAGLAVLASDGLMKEKP
jgi:hypothetical protein